jgi:hypothetical protein
MKSPYEHEGGPSARAGGSLGTATSLHKALRRNARRRPFLLLGQATDVVEFPIEVKRPCGNT